MPLRQALIWARVLFTAAACCRSVASQSSQHIKSPTLTYNRSTNSMLLTHAAPGCCCSFCGITRPVHLTLRAPAHLHHATAAAAAAPPSAGTTSNAQISTAVPPCSPPCAMLCPAVPTRAQVPQAAAIICLMALARARACLSKCLRAHSVSARRSLCQAVGGGLRGRAM